MTARRPRVVAIVQARTGSSRLPRKVLEDIGGAPMLARVMDRLGRARTLDALVVATTVEPLDDVLADLAAERGWACHRGPVEDVLARYHQAAVAHGADVVVRVCSDCPLIDPAIVDRVVATLLADPALAYVSNNTPARTYPIGLDVEAFTFAALDSAHREDERPELREHVTPFIKRDPARFPAAGVAATGPDRSELRWTVDVDVDLEMMRRVYAGAGDVGAAEVLGWLDRHPEVAALNRDVAQKTIAGG